MYIIRNETNAFLTNTGKWTWDKTEAMTFDEYHTAEALIEDLISILPAFYDLFPEVIPY